MSVAARSRGTFELLWCWLNGEVLYESPAEMLNEQHRLALTSSVRRTRYGFALVVERNWRWEEQTREVHLNGPALRELWKLPEGAAVDRLLGYDDGPTWRPGIAGLEPQEARALRFTVVMHWGMGDIQRHTGLTARSIYNARSEAKAKLRRFFGMPPARPAKEEARPGA